jgi:hypothetical protein
MKEVAKMTLYQLEVLLAVVKTGSFTKAGELLLASQSGVSHTIADLEKVKAEQYESALFLAFQPM